MSLHYAILGLLTFEPMSGYTLKTRYFDRSVAHFWPADQAQIYRTLQSMEQAGEVDSRAVASDIRPSSRIYALTESGRTALCDWLARQQQVPVQRDGFLIQLYFGRLLSPEQLLTVLHDRRAEHLRQAAYFDALRIPDPESEDMRRQIVFGGMTLDFARRRERMMIEWLDACIDTARSLFDADAMPS
jgi:PadR family transcriptional regulator, regulatory protein AphA